MFSQRLLLRVCVVVAVVPHIAGFVPTASPLLRSLQGMTCRTASKPTGALRMADATDMVPRRRALDIMKAGSIFAAVWFGGARGADAKNKPKAAASEEQVASAEAIPEISLADFITALEAEEVESVEFDGPMYEVVPIPKEVSSRYSNALARLPACPVLAPTHACLISCPLVVCRGHT